MPPVDNSQKFFKDPTIVTEKKGGPGASGRVLPRTSWFSVYYSRSIPNNAFAASYSTNSTLCLISKADHGVSMCLVWGLGVTGWIQPCFFRRGSTHFMFSLEVGFIP